MLIAFAVVMLFVHGVHSDGALVNGLARVVARLVAGFFISVVAAVIRVAGSALPDSLL